MNRSGMAISILVVVAAGLLPFVDAHAAAASARCRNNRTTLLRCRPAATAGSSSLAELSTSISFRVDGRTRTATAFVPTRTPADVLPLVVVLHGGGGSAEKMAASTRFEDLARRERFAVVFPDGVDGNWNDGRADAVSTASKENIDDVTFTRNLIDVVASKAPINRAKVYVTGMSNGAMMTIRLACETSGLFAGFAAVSGNGRADLANVCTPAIPVSLLQIHGTADPIVPYQGGTVTNPFGSQSRGTVLSVDELASVFTRNGGCNPTPTTGAVPDRAPRDGSTITTRTWNGCGSRTEVSFWRVEGGGHVWPGEQSRLPERVVGKGNKDIDATAEIWRFFANLK
jgi:polyhydroxybutyrate depolymerase